MYRVRPCPPLSGGQFPWLLCGIMVTFFNLLADGRLCSQLGVWTHKNNNNNNNQKQKPKKTTKLHAVVPNSRVSRCSEPKIETEKYGFTD